MLRVLSMVPGGGTNLQAIIDSVKNGMITNTELVGVISNNKNAYALTRAKENGIDAKCISPKDYESREVFNQELLKAVEVHNGDTPEVLQRRVMEQAEWKILPHAIDLIANGKVEVEGHRTIVTE